MMVAGFVAATNAVEVKTNDSRKNIFGTLLLCLYCTIFTNEFSHASYIRSIRRHVNWMEKTRDG